MNPAYVWVLHREAGHVLLPLRSKFRRQLEGDFDRIAEHPFIEPQEVCRTSEGLEVRFLWRDPFWIGYILDHAVRQVRIVSLTREKIFDQ